MVLLLTSFLVKAEPGAAPVNVCVHSGTHWAPYVYEHKQQNVSSLRGVSVAVIDRVFSLLSLDYRLKAIPWGRVLNHLEQSQDKTACELVWDISWSELRESKLHFSRPLYKISAGAFYSLSFNPEMESLKGVTNIFSYKVCGIRGYNYAPVEAAVSMYVTRNQQAIELLRLGRCDLFVNARQPVDYDAAQGLYDLGEDIRYIHAALFDRNMYVGVSRASQRADELLAQVNQALESLEQQGEIDTIFARFGVDRAM